MKHRIIAILILMFLAGCSSGEESLILGSWEVVEYQVSGNKHASGRTIEFSSDGTYTTYEAGEDEIKGEWRVKNGTLVMHQPEIRDLHGARSVEPFTRVWEVEVAEKWMMLQGTARSDTQDMRLVLRKKED